MKKAEKSFTVNGRGHLAIGGVDALELAGQFGTPLYVFDEEAVRRTCRRYREALSRSYGEGGLALYASKAFSCKEIYRIVGSEGLGADVVSAGELYTALEAGFAAARIYYHGNNKTDDELIFAMEKGVGAIVVDNLPELRRLARFCQRMGKSQDVLLRIKPGIDAHTHNYIRTGQIDSKFGFALETGEALEAVRETLATEGVHLRGLHCHIGSQIFDAQPFVDAARVMVHFMGEIRRSCGATLTTLNLGGGFGVQYMEGDDPVPFEETLAEVAAVLRGTCKEEGIPQPFMLVEPGRSIVNSACATLYTVGARKEIPGVRTYVSVDGGMTDNPRYALYHAQYEAVVANRAGEKRDEHVTLAGKCCESGDLLGEDMPLQHCDSGDILAVLCTGAYNFSMASGYNRIRRPAVVMVKDGLARLVVRRETLEDIVRCDI